MTGLTTETMPSGRTFDRVLGVHDDGQPGPTLIALGGIHGNEPAGVVALLRVLRKLRQAKLQLSGRLIALAGNLGALQEVQRFIVRDLNRAWHDGLLQSIIEQDPSLDTAEDREQRELVREFQRAEASATGPVVALDLHTSSSDGPSFSCLADTLANRRIALALPIPTILGLEEAIEGAVLDWFADRGHCALAVEGGRHDDRHTIDNLEAAVWVSLVAAKLLPPDAVDLTPYRTALQRSAGGMPRVLEIVYRHAITQQDEFVMEPGFESFVGVRKGQLLARDRRGEIRAPNDLRMLLPLYQGQGEDGYFLCREVSRFWLLVAWCMRKARLDRIVHWLPGVRRAADDPNTLEVDSRVARLFAVQVFHLLGFRRRRASNGPLHRFSRRPVQ